MSSVKWVLIVGSVTAITFNFATSVVSGWFPDTLYLTFYNLTPYEIFSNQINTFDVNFFNPQDDKITKTEYSTNIEEYFWEEIGKKAIDKYNENEEYNKNEYYQLNDTDISKLENAYNYYGCCDYFDIYPLEMDDVLKILGSKMGISDDLNSSKFEYTKIEGTEFNVNDFLNQNKYIEYSKQTNDLFICYKSTLPSSLRESNSMLTNCEEMTAYVFVCYNSLNGQMGAIALMETSEITGRR